MKKVVFLILILSAFASGFAKNVSKDPNKAWYEPARYIKLALSYREIGDYNTAIYILNQKSLMPLEKIYNKKKRQGANYINYYIGAAKENLGYCYLSLNDEKTAYEYLKEALGNYLLFDEKEFSVDIRPLKKVISKIEGNIDEEAELSLQDYIPKIRDSEKFDDEFFEKILEKSREIAQSGSNKKNNLNLSVLSLDDQKLTEIPTNTDKRFTKVSLVNNKISNLSSILTYFPKIQDLYLDNNPISYLPENIGDFRSLKTLSLSNTKIKEMPNAIGDLKNLERLIISNTQISKLPPNILELKNLRLLDLRNTPKLNFIEIKKIIQNLPNTVILHDRYVRESEKVEVEGE